MGHTACLPVPGQVVVLAMRACYICIFIVFIFIFFNFHPRFEKLKKILHIEDMESKHKRMINCFKLEMERFFK